MKLAQIVLYIAAVILLVVAAFWRRNPPPVSLVCLAGACALLAFSLPTIAGGTS